MSNPAVFIDLDNVLKDASAVSPVLYQYYHSLQNRTIVLNEEIDTDVIENVVLPLQEMDNDGSGKPIKIILNTQGGDIYSGMALCDAIDHLKTPTTVVVLSMAASMGALISMAGFNNPHVTRLCGRYSVFLIHAGSISLGGEANEVRDNFRFQEDYEKLLTDYVLTHSKIPAKLYEEKNRHQWWMTAVEAKQYGLVDKIIGMEDEDGQA